MKKIKRFFLLLLIVSNWTFAQYGEDSISISPPQVEEYYEEESSDESYTTPTREQRGPIFYEQRKLDPNFKNDYKGDKYNYDKVVKEKEPKKRTQSSSSKPIQLPTGVFSVLMYSILGIIILLVIYFIFKNAGGFSFGEEKRKIKFDSSEEEELEDTEDIANNDFQKLIQKAKSENDFRRAVRYYYLWVLQKLTDRNMIKFNKDKTDYDYFIELAHNPIKEDFSNNTYIYDYVWYGKFELNAQEFDLAESIFQRTLNKLK